MRALTGRRPLALAAPPFAFFSLSAALSLKCLFNQRDTCSKIKCGPLVTQLMAACVPAPLSAASAWAKLATFHKQFHRLVTQLDVYWKITDFPQAILVPHLGGRAVAHIIELNYNRSPVSVWLLIYESFVLKYSLFQDLSSLAHLQLYTSQHHHLVLNDWRTWPGHLSLVFLNVHV